MQTPMLKQKIVFIANGFWDRIHNTTFSFVTYKSAQKARVLHNTTLERLANYKQLQTL
jgi:hypothetical protein